MGKALRILVVLILVLGIVAAVFAWLNFSNREVLIGRTHALEDAFAKLSRTLEASDQPESPRPDYPRRDISDVTSRELENPERSDFWNSYNHNLEPAAQPVPTLDYTSDEKLRDLRGYYRIDPATGKPAIDTRTGRPDTRGPMQELLDEAFERAKSQYAILNQTRAELPRLRAELVDAIEALNRQKQAGRADKRTIEERDARIVVIEREKDELNNRNTRLEEDIRAVRTELQEANELVAKHEEDVKILEDKVAMQAKTIEELKGKGPLLPIDGAARPAQNMEGVLTPGVKGKIVSANEEWKFAVIEFSDAFMDELLGPGRELAMAQVEMMVKRPGFEGMAGGFITRLRLRQVVRDKNLVVADILTDWQQYPVATGDEVFF